MSKMAVTLNCCCFHIFLFLFLEYRRTQGVNKCRADERGNAAEVAVHAARDLAVGREQDQEGFFKHLAKTIPYQRVNCIGGVTNIALYCTSRCLCFCAYLFHVQVEAALFSYHYWSLVDEF